MRRLWASLVIALFVGTPIAQWCCAMDCALDDMAPSMVCQHAAAQSGSATLRSRDDCPADRSAQPVIVTASQASASVVTAFSVGGVTEVELATSASLAPAHLAAPPGGPPGRFGIPLRV